MNLLDLALLGLLILAVAGGLRDGFVARAASWAGLVAGVVASTRTVPWALAIVQQQQPAFRLVVGIATFTLTVAGAAALAGLLVSGIRRTIAAGPLGSVDRAAGAVASVAVLIGMVWLIVPAAADVPGAIARQVRTSWIVATVEAATPDPPDAFRAFRRIIDTTRFPEVFADLAPSPPTSLPPEQVAVPADVVERAVTSTAHVRAEGCGRRYEGSSFVIGVDLVITNAHVVAGADHVRIRFPDGATHDATVVVFDPDRDLALMEVPGIDRRALEISRAVLGGDGAALGYPGGRLDPRVAAARFEDRRQAIGRDIYGSQRTTRSVVFLAARLVQGDSGSAVIDVDGRVGGVVFAVSPDNPQVAYALDTEEVEAVLAAPRRPGETGECL